MGTINESLILTDQFSGSFSRFLDLGNSMTAQMGRIDQSVLGMEATMRRSIGGAAGAIISNMREIGDAANQISSSGFDRLEAQLTQIAENTSQAAGEQNRYMREVNNTNNASQQLLSTIKRIVAVAAGFTLGKKVLGLSDAMTQTTARINLMTGSLEETRQVQQMIYESALRTGTSYLGMSDVVAKLGQRAGDAFNGSAEIVQFAENLNKQFVMAGANQQEIASASLQLTQALGAGVLRGQDLNAVFEAAPNVIQTIADYMGVPIGKIRDMAADGQITAEIVKDAMLGATDKISEQFDAMPLTWGRAWEDVKSAAVKSMSGAMDEINDILNSDIGKEMLNGLIGSFEVLSDMAGAAVDGLAAGAEFVAENWELVSGVLIGAAAAIGLSMVAAGFSAMAAWLAAAWPLVLIAALIAAAVYGALQAGATFEQIGEVIGTVLGGIYAVGYNLVADLWNLFAVFAEFFANVLNDPVAAIAYLFFGLLDTILGIVETVANAIDALLKTDISGAIAGFRGQMNDWVDDTFGENAVKIERMAQLDTADAASKGGKIGAELGKKMDDMNFNLDDITGKLGGLGAAGAGGSLGDIGNVGKVGSVGKIDQDVNIADENIKLLRDLSERQYVALVNLTVPQTNATINQTVNGGNGSDANAIMNTMTKLLERQHASSSNLARA